MGWDIYLWMSVERLLEVVDGNCQEEGGGLSAKQPLRLPYGCGFRPGRLEDVIVIVVKPRLHGRNVVPRRKDPPKDVERLPEYGARIAAGPRPALAIDLASCAVQTSGVCGSRAVPPVQEVHGTSSQARAL